MWVKNPHKCRESCLKILGRLMQRAELVKNSAPDDQLQSVVAAAYTSCSKHLYLPPDCLSVHLLALLFCAAGFSLTIRSCQSILPTVSTSWILLLEVSLVLSSFLHFDHQLSAALWLLVSCCCRPAAFISKYRHTLAAVLHLCRIFLLLPLPALL